MKDKTHSMNMEHNMGGAVNGYTSAGKPEPTNAPHKRRMQQGGLSDDKALSDYENNDGDEGGYSVGGFLNRANWSDRF